jgi:putative flippase GtrA
MLRTLGTLANGVPPYLRYIAVSAAALAVDMAMFLVLIAMDMSPAIASGLSYLTGMIAHWFLSSRLVFGAYLAQPGAARGKQQGLFLMSALAGLTLTMVIVGIGDGMGLDPRLAKLVAVAVSFNATYLMRRKIVFA